MEWNTLRDLCTRVTTAAAPASASSQQNRRLNQRAAEGSRETFTSNSAGTESTKDTLFWVEVCAAVLSHDGQGGALLREVANLAKFGSDTQATPDPAYWDVQ